jgi:ribosome maturation factor RimP
MGTSGEMEVETMIRPVIEGAGLELVHAEFHREAGRRVLRVTVERDPAEGPLDLDAVSQVSERISRRLDVEGFDPPGGPYTLEVSSPGLERPLRSPRDFARHVGERVRVRTVEPLAGSRTHAGALVEASADGITVATDDGARRIPYEAVSSARTVFEWGGQPKRQGAKRTKKVTTK